MNSEPPIPDVSAFREALGEPLFTALERKGYVTLTSVQRQVLAEGVVGKDLRISSQTGSGKTLAIGFVLREALESKGEGEPDKKAPRSKNGHPRAIVVVPTRELAKQVSLELSWLYASMNALVCSVAGGASYRDEHRTLASNPAVVVGTPGRLLDHLRRESIATDRVKAVVLDEADQMLDLGFREELDAILDALPKERRTHLVSATFSPEVKVLADRVQQNPMRVEGTPLGSANTDIEHIVHVIEQREVTSALINVLLRHPDQQTLVFAKTRADVAELSRELQLSGFRAGSLSGDMEQAARNKALAAFKRGELKALVATDVAARGIDVQNIARVVQVDPPANSDTYTHRSGRTGRAGRKGESVVLVTRGTLRRTEAVLNRARIKFRFEPVPTREQIEREQDERWLTELGEGPTLITERVLRQVERIVASGRTEAALTKLLADHAQTQGAPRDVTVVRQDAPRNRPVRDDRGPAPRGNGPRRGQDDRTWVSFRVTFGEVHGADARRLVAMLCRRGQIRGADIGAIRVGRMFSEVDVSTEVAQAFGSATSAPDPRDPRIKISPAGPAQPSRPPTRTPHRGGPVKPWARKKTIDVAGESPPLRKPKKKDS